METYIDSYLVTKLTEREAEQLEGFLTYSDISKTLKNMKNDKGPGLSGFLADFLNVIWKQLGFLVLRSINFEYSTGDFSTTQKQGIIACIPKDKLKNSLLFWILYIK